MDDDTRKRLQTCPDLASCHAKQLDASVDGPADHDKRILKGETAQRKRKVESVSNITPSQMLDLRQISGRSDKRRIVESDLVPSEAIMGACILASLLILEIDARRAIRC